MGHKVSGFFLKNGLGVKPSVPYFSATEVKIGAVGFPARVPRRLWIFCRHSGLYSGMKLRVAVSVDEHTPMLVEVSGSGGAENEDGPIRSAAVQNNYVNARIPMPGLTAGKHTLKIRAMDPGAVVDAISLP
jgi:hypothetical protein